MATTKVTLQIEPFDLQLICDGLTLYRAVMSALEQGITPEELGTWIFGLRLPLYNGEPGYCHGQANRLLAVMGLRDAGERSPQLRMWGDARVETETYFEPQEDATAAEGTGDDEDATGAEDGHMVATVILKTTDDLASFGLDEDPAG